MPSRRLADQRIRAAQQGVPGLDVRGPVSEALRKTGLSVPPVADELAEAATPATPEVPARRAARAAPSARRVVKPFEPAPWPTTRASEAEPRALLGLTPDERRVHQILIDALALNSQSGLGDGSGIVGLSYLERKKLGALDLAFINAEIAKMDGGGSLSDRTVRWTIGLGGAAFAGLATALLMSGGEVGTTGTLLSAVTFVLVMVSLLSRPNVSAGAVAQRRTIYHALRELALLVDPDDVTSQAVAQADAVIDRMAAPAIRTDLLDHPAPGAAPRRSRVRT